jgi:hypothetical protein
LGTGGWRARVNLKNRFHSTKQARELGALSGDSFHEVKLTIPPEQFNLSIPKISSGVQIVAFRATTESTLQVLVDSFSCAV